MDLNAIKARLGSIGPRQMEALGNGVRRLLTEDLPLLLKLVEESQAMPQATAALWKMPEGEADAN